MSGGIHRCLYNMLTQRNRHRTLEKRKKSTFNHAVFQRGMALAHSTGNCDVINTYQELRKSVNFLCTKLQTSTRKQPTNEITLNSVVYIAKNTVVNCVRPINFTMQKVLIYQAAKALTCVNRCESWKWFAEKARKKGKIPTDQGTSFERDKRTLP